MFYAGYVLSELRRRKGRTVLTALGLAVGVGLVITVSALSDGLDRAQAQVLKPLTGLGTDLSVTRPLRESGGDIAGPPGAGLSQGERDQLRRENRGRRFGLSDLGEPGEKFETDNFVSAAQLSFPASQVREIAGLAGVREVAAGLTVNALHVSGTVPEQPPQPGGFGGGPPEDIDIESMTVTGVDASAPGLAAISPSQVGSGRYLRASDAREAVLNVAYARRKGLSVGDEVVLKRRTYEVVGLAAPPLGGQASDVYVNLDQLQRASDREGRANGLYVRASDAGVVEAVAGRIERAFPGAEATTAKDLAKRVGGSLIDAKKLSSNLGVALQVVGLLAAFLIACLLTLSSVAKRVRELGTLKALGWTQGLVVRQVTGEAVVQGALGGVLGAALGLAGAAAIEAIGPTLEASVAGPGGPGGPGPGRLAIFGQGQLASGTESLALGAPVDAGLVALAIGLALLGGLVAGAAGGVRAARLRPADALRHID